MGPNARDCAQGHCAGAAAASGTSTFARHAVFIRQQGAGFGSNCRVLVFLVLGLSCVYSMSCKEDLDERVDGNITHRVVVIPVNHSLTATQ